MTDPEFREKLDRLIGDDPWPADAGDWDAFLAMLDTEAIRRGFKHAHDAYHRFQGNTALRVVRSA